MNPHPFDLLAKGLLDASLSPACRVDVQEPAVTDTLYADTVIEPLPDRRALLHRCGLLGRIAQTPCVVEPFSSTVDVMDVERCCARTSLLRSQRNVDYALWVLCPGRPTKVLARWRMKAMRAWGEGFYRSAVPSCPRVVVLSELAATHDTLLLRLMGRGETFARAHRDYAALPAEAWERTFLPKLLLQVRSELTRMGAPDALPEELRMRYQEIYPPYDEDRAAARAEGIAIGEARGVAIGEARGVAVLRESIVALCEVLGLTLDDDTRARIASANLDALTGMFERLRRTRSLP